MKTQSDQEQINDAGEISYGIRPIITLASLFFIIGFVTWLNGPLITFVQLAFSLSDVGAFLVPLCFYLSYLVFPLPATLVARRTGLRGGLILSLVIVSCGLAVFGQCISLRSYAGALVGLSIIGAGLSLLQITINPYVTFLGSPKRAAQRIAIMGVANKLAGMIAPVVLALLVMRHIDEIAIRIKSAPDAAARDQILNHFVSAVHAPYLIMAGLLLVAALLVKRSGLPDIPLSDTENESPRPGKHGGYMWLGVLSMFVYVGVEVMAGDAIGVYGRNFGLPLDQTKFLTALTLTAMLMGYITGAVLVPRVFSQETYISLSSTAGLLLCAVAWSTSGYVSVLCVALFGFANAMILPGLFPLVLQAMKSRASLATALLVMAFSGGAILPQIFIQLAPWLGVQNAFVLLMAPAYLIILVYACMTQQRDGNQVLPATLVEP